MGHAYAIAVLDEALSKNAFNTEDTNRWIEQSHTELEAHTANLAQLKQQKAEIQAAKDELAAE